MFTLTLAGIPIAVGANEAVHQQRLLDEEAEATERLEEFYIDVFCDTQSKKVDEVNGSMVVLREGKLYLHPKDAKTNLPTPRPDSKESPHAFTGFYLPFPDSDLPHRPIPYAPILGLVSTIPTSDARPEQPQRALEDDSSPSPRRKSQQTSVPSSSPSKQPVQETKPKLNWLFIDKTSQRLHYGPRGAAKKHTIGHWDWTDDEVGIMLDGEELFVAVEEKRGGYDWAIYWDKHDDRLKGLGLGNEKRVLRCSLERRVVHGKNTTGLDESD